MPSNSPDTMSHDDSLSWLDNGGDTGALIRGFPWVDTPLGPLQGWPQSLRTATSLLLLSPVPIVLLWGEQGRMIYNDAYSVFAGSRHPALLGSEVRKGWDEIADFNDNVMRVVLAGGTLAYKNQQLTLLRHGQPEAVWMNLDYSPVLDETGRPGGVIAIVVETTQGVRAEAALRDSERGFREALEAKVAERTEALLKAEQALMQAQKMEALGSLTGGIAHDFNNLLMAVQGSLELLSERLPPDRQLRRLMEHAMAGAERGSTLTRRMLAFARRQELKPERVDIETLVGNMTGLIQHALGPTVVIESSFDEGLPLVETDVNQLEAALLNLAVNARDAMEGVGTLHIHAGTTVLPTRDAALGPGTYVTLSLSDTGMGMDASTLKRAVEPFFTTKGVGKGTGLGLSMVHGLAEQSGGMLRLSSRPGEGTRAEVWLPAVEGVVAAVETVVADPATDALPAGNHAPAGCLPLTVLTVDDDALVRATTAEMLLDLGHRVIVADSAAQALQLLQANAVDLVITDHAMPRMTGMQLAMELRRSHPGLPVIMATGYADLASDPCIDLPRLAKPYSQAALAAILSQTLHCSA